MNKLDEYKKTDFGYELDDEEAELLKAMDDGQFEPAIDLEARKEELQKTAASFTKMKRKSINIRIPEYNLSRIKSQANRQGLPYQTLINSILQQYLENEKRA